MKTEKSLRYPVVTLRSATGLIERVVVGDLGNVLAVCTMEEIEAAEREARPPTVVGFKKSSIVKAERSDR